jgi:IclR family acetate operon transcriptional repressor
MQNPIGATPARRPPAYPIASVDRALRLLLLVGRRSRVRLSEASDALGVAPSTAHRLLAMLAFHGFVRPDGDRHGYVAGPALAEIGRSAVREADLRRLARPLVEDLAERTGETVHLAVLDGRLVRYVDAVESAHALRVAARTGRSLPAHCTAAGKALLAALTPRQASALLAGTDLEAATARSITARGVLARQLAKARRAGHAVNVEESEDGVASVAAAVRDRGRALAAISVAGPVGRMNALRREVVAGEVRAAAARLEEALRS